MHANSPQSWDCKDSKFNYSVAGHVTITGNLKIISDSRIRHIVSKDQNKGFLSHIDLKNVGKK